MVKYIQKFITLLFIITLTPRVIADAPGEHFPVFDGTVMSIQVPFNPEYRPRKTIVTIQTTGDVTMLVKIEQTVRRVGDTLEWTANENELTIQGKRLRSKIPLLSLRCISSKKGGSNDVEITAPGFIDAVIDSGLIKKSEVPKKGSPEYEQLLDQFIPKKGTIEYNRFIQQMAFAQQLPEEGIVSGSVLFTQPMTFESVNNPNKETTVISNVANTIAKGWGYYQNQKVLVTEIFYDGPIDVDGSTGTTTTMGGYALYDVNTFSVVKSEVLAIITDHTNGKTTNIKMHMNMDGKTTETE